MSTPSIPLVTYERLMAAGRELGAATGVGELFANGAAAACAVCGFDRGLVLSVRGHSLAASSSDALPDPASDTLRRRTLSEPIPIKPKTLEAALVEGRAPANPSAASSHLQQRLELREFVASPIAPQHHVLGLLVMDRSEPEVTAVDRALADGFATLLAGSLERIVLRARTSEVSSELRYMSASAQALMAEILETPVSLPVEDGHGTTFAPVGAADRADPAMYAALSARERQVAALLAAGRSNREIADELVVSPETVKGHVGRILRKLNAANRAEAVARFLGNA